MSATARRRERRGQLEAAQLRIRELEALLRSTRPWLLQRLAAGEQNCARLRAELRCAHVMAAERTGETERLRAATRALEAEQYASSPQGKLENALSFTAEQSSDLWRRGSQGFSAAFAGLLAEAAAGADATTEDGGAAGASGTDDDDDDDDDDGTAGTSHASTHSGAERSAGGGVEIPPPSPPQQQQHQQQQQQQLPRLPRAPLGVDDALAPAPPPPPRPPPLPVLLDDDAALVQANAHADAEAARLADEVGDHRVLLAQLGGELLAARRRAMEVGVAQWAVQHAHEAAHDAAEDVADAEVEAAAAAAAAATVAAAAAAAAVGAGSVGTREAELAALRAQVAAAAAEADADAKRRASSLLPSERD